MIDDDSSRESQPFSEYCGFEHVPSQLCFRLWQEQMTVPVRRSNLCHNGIEKVGKDC